MDGKLTSVWSAELEEAMYERFGIDLAGEMLKAFLNGKNQKTRRTEMDDNHIVMFNHDYSKLRGQRSGKLVHAEIVRIDDTFSKEALEYDTDGLYELEKNTYYIQAVFLGDKDIPFTTYRTETPENRRKYFNHIGEEFEFVVHTHEV